MSSVPKRFSKRYNIPERYKKKLLARFNYDNAINQYSSMHDSDLESVRYKKIDISCALCDDYENPAGAVSCTGCPLNEDTGILSDCVKILSKRFNRNALQKAGLFRNKLVWKPADDDVVKDLLNNIHNALQTKVNWT